MTVTNLVASVHARLQNRARATNRPFQELLQYYAMERFLYRLSQSPHRTSFILKGALMLHVWDAPLARATKDVDLLGRLGNSLENLERVVRELCAAEVVPDGMVFDPTSVKAQRIKEGADYPGVRVRFIGRLGRASVAMQIDVGFGDVVTPMSQDITYPALLDFPAPELSGYPRETVVRTLNSRMKDFYDVWLLASQYAFDGTLLATAVAATFAHRETAIDQAPIAFTPEFTEQSSTRAQWTAFRNRLPKRAVPGATRRRRDIPIGVPAAGRPRLRHRRACGALDTWRTMGHQLVADRRLSPGRWPGSAHPSGPRWR